MNMALPKPGRAPALAVDILVEAGDWPAEAKLAARWSSARSPPRSPRPRRRLPEPPKSAVVFTDDAHIRVLNRRYRGKDSADQRPVVSRAARRSPGAFGPLLGDIVLARETIASEAGGRGLALDDHLTHLIVHGFLHLLGYDHGDEREAAVMEGLETAILARLGIADPYADG